MWLSKRMINLIVPVLRDRASDYFPLLKNAEIWSFKVKVLTLQGSRGALPIDAS